MNDATTRATCGKCAGSGTFTFKSGAKGVCFPCEGTGSAVPEVTTARPVTRRSNVGGDLRAMYRNARAGVLSHADVFDADGLGWTPGGLDAAFAAVPASRAAFRAIGWPV